MLSIIIPIGPHDNVPVELLASLDTLPKDSEIILAVAEGKKIDTGSASSFPAIKIVEGKAGRAAQMNAAARWASGKFLWFIHADSELENNAVRGLLTRLNQEPQALYYHDLEFTDDGPRQMYLNSRAVRWRSDFLKLPFGDQAFCLPRQHFFSFGCYDESAAFGEDYLLVWKAHQMGLPVKRTGYKIWTSARKYQSGGWGKVTLTHIFLTFKQGAPEFFKLLKIKLMRSEK